jgi:Tol biopolymer transport system component
MRVLFLGLAAAIACGCDDDPPPIDAPIDEAPRCNTTKQFGTPVLIDSLNTDFDDATPRLSPDELAIVFSRRSSAGNFDLWSATRTNRDEPFGAPSLLTTVNSVNSDLWPSQSSDGLTLIFDADRTTPDNFRIWMSTRASTSVPFGPPALRPELMNNEFHGILANDRALYFASTARAGLGGADIWRADVSATNTIGTPIALVGGVNTDEEELAPALTPDETTIVFRRSTTTPPVPPATTPTIEYDVYTASRSTPLDGFGPSSKVDTLALPNIVETPSWVSPDNCALYGFTNAPGGPGGSNLYVAVRPQF